MCGQRMALRPLPFCQNTPLSLFLEVVQPIALRSLPWHDPCMALGPGPAQTGAPNGLDTGEEGPRFPYMKSFIVVSIAHQIQSLIKEIK
jgi:hypothetical protein